MLPFPIYAGSVTQMGWSAGWRFLSALSLWLLVLVMGDTGHHFPILPKQPLDRTSVLFVSLFLRLSLNVLTVLVLSPWGTFVCVIL